MTVQTTAETLKGVTVDDAARERLFSAKSPATRRHVIYFTPRSGSSWLTTALAETNVLGHAGEYLNPSFIHSIASSLNVNTLETYLDALLRSRKTDNDVFTIEMTYFHFRKFEGDDLFFKYFSPKAPSIYLIRENIVSQAISLYKAVETQVFHTASAADEKIAQSRSFADYDGEKIQSWVRHIRQQEIGLEALFAVKEIEPLRISYERVFGMYSDPVALVAEHLGLPAESIPPAENRAGAHTKLASASNREMEARFRADYREFVEQVDAERGAIIEKLYASPPRSGRPAISRVRKAGRVRSETPDVVDTSTPPHPPKPLSQSRILQLAGDSLRAKRPFSAIRFGDGEGMFLGGDGSIFPPAARNEAYKVLFGTEPSVEAFSDLSERMKDAYRDADVIGRPTESDTTNYRWSRASRVFDALNLKSETCYPAHTSFHQNIFASERLGDLIRDARRVVIVTPHPIVDLFRKLFDVDVEWVRLPGEAKYLSPGDRHYPDRFREICATLSSDDFAGCLALVGAGFCGKVYCGVFKKAGGVAIDVGSAFDELAGFPTRAYMSKFMDFEQMLERISSLPMGDDPYSARVLFFKSCHLERLGRLDEALAASQESLARSPTPTDRGIFHHISLLSRLGRTDEARRFLHRICSSYPDASRDAWLALGDQFSISGEHVQSAIAYEQAYYLDRSNVFVLKRYIAALVRTGEHKEVVRLKGEIARMADTANEILAMIARAEGEWGKQATADASKEREPVAKRA